MKILEAFKLAREGKGILIIRNPIKHGQKSIEFYPYLFEENEK